VPLCEFNLTACPLVQSSWKTPFQTWIWTQVGESPQPIRPAGTVTYEQWFSPLSHRRIHLTTIFHVVCWAIAAVATLACARHCIGTMKIWCTPYINMAHHANFLMPYSVPQKALKGLTEKLSISTVFYELILCASAVTNPSKRTINEWMNVYKSKNATMTTKLMKLTCIWKLVWNFLGPSGRYLTVSICWLRGFM